MPPYIPSLHQVHHLQIVAVAVLVDTSLAAAGGSILLVVVDILAAVRNLVVAGSRLVGGNSRPVGVGSKRSEGTAVVAEWQRKVHGLAVVRCRTYGARQPQRAVECIREEDLRARPGSLLVCGSLE